MAEMKLSFAIRKALCVQLGDSPGTEVAELLKDLLDRVEYLERSKVDVTPIVPMARSLSAYQPLRRVP